MKKENNKTYVPGRLNTRVNSVSRNLPLCAAGMTSKSPYVYIRTFGCQMNNRDSEFIAGLFLEKGYKLADSPDEAEVILFNTCSVREHAEQRAVSSMRQLMHKYKNRIYGVVGCAAQALGKKLFMRLAELDIVCGTGEIARLPELVEKARGSKILALDKKDAPLPEVLRRGVLQYAPTDREKSSHAYVSIMRGCNNFCSYCIVPYVRGKERSRNAEDIVREVKDLAEQGITDIMLLGQNVNSYKEIEVTSAGYPQSRGGLNLPYSVDNLPRNGGRTKACNFVQLLGRVNEIKDIQKVRFMTSHPKDANATLFRTMRDCEKLVKHLHLPLQSGSDRILRLMSRGYTSGKYYDLVSRAREIIPNLRLTTDIIVGFPTEAERDFDDTLNLVRKIRFNAAYIFKYSPRPGTKAAKIPDDVPENTKKTRHKILLDLQREISRESKDEKNHCLCNN